MVERPDPDNFTRLQTRERCALEIAAYVFNWGLWFLRRYIDGSTVRAILTEVQRSTWPSILSYCHCLTIMFLASTSIEKNLVFKIFSCAMLHLPYTMLKST